MTQASYSPKHKLNDQDYLDYEYYACASDFWYWLKHFGWMKNEERSLLIGPGIELWPTLPDYQGQREYLEMALAGEWILVGKSRRLGISWLSANLECWDGLFHDDVSQAVIAQDDNWSIRHQARTRFIYGQQPAHLRRAIPLVGMDNKHELGLSNRSVFNAWPSTSGSIRGAGKKRVRCEETAHWQNPEEAWTAIQSAAAQVIVISTGHGEEGLYYDKWQQPGKLRLFFMPWFACPGRDEAWYEEERETAASEAHHRQEHPAVPEEMFLAAGTKFWDPLVIRELEQHYTREPIQQREGGTWRIYAEALPGRQYVIGADPSDGGGDGCFAQCLDIQSGRQVAVLESYTWSADEFADHLNLLGREYNAAVLAVERNNMGVSTLSTLIRELKYPLGRIYKHDDPELPKKPGEKKRRKRPGWLTDKTSRADMLGGCRRAVERMAVTVYDENTYKQLKAFGYYGGRWQHPPKQKDDGVISLSIAQAVRIQLLLHLK